jgi:hypothetical protein
MANTLRCPECETETAFPAPGATFIHADCRSDAENAPPAYAPSTLPLYFASLLDRVAMEHIDPEAFARDYFPGSFRDI